MLKPLWTLPRAIDLLTPVYAALPSSLRRGWRARCGAPAGRPWSKRKRTEDVIENTGSWKNNMRVRIWIEGNARGRTLRFVFGPRRRRRLTARVIPLGSVAELSALWRRVFCSVAGLTGEAASWDTQLPTPSTLLS